MEPAKQATLANQADASQSGQPAPSHTTPANRIFPHPKDPSSAAPAERAQTSYPPAADRPAPMASGIAPVNDEQPATATTINAELNDTEKAVAILKIAADAFASSGSWVVFYRDMLGVNGLVHRTFDTEAKFQQFQKTAQFAELQEMVAALRSQDTSKGDAVEAEKMITIRLPDSLHKVLTAEAEAMNLSINKLCISKLLQPVESRFVPVQQGRRRGRKPGPQGSRKNSPATASE